MKQTTNNTITITTTLDEESLKDATERIVALKQKIEELKTAADELSSSICALNINLE